MPDRYEVEITTDARRDLRSIYNVIAKRSPRIASKMIGRLLDACATLDLAPHRHAVPRNRYSRGRNVRAMPLWPYIIRYRIDESHRTVFVMHVRHGARRKP
jgi:plasmid stabilization system protein ParE